MLHGGGEAGARRLLDRLAAAWRETDPLVAYSAGYAACPEDGAGAATLEAADQALYRAKRGREELVGID